MWTRLRRVPIALVGAVMMVVVLLAACTGADDSGGDAASDIGQEAATDEAADQRGSDLAAGGEVAAQEPDDSGVGDPGPDQDGTEPDATTGRQLVYRATVTLASADPDATASQVRALATDSGGFVSGTQLSRDELGLLRGSITIRVPADQLDTLLDQVSDAAAQVTALERTVEDVTGRVADIEARLRNLRALEDELLVLLTEAREAGDTGDVLDVFDRVGEVRGEIETLEGRRADLGEQVALSTLTVMVEPTPGLVESVSSTPDADLPLPWNPGNVAASAWDSTVAAVQAFVDTVIRLAVFALPVLLVWVSPVLVVLALVWWWRRRHRDADGNTDGVEAGLDEAHPDVRDAAASGSIGGRDGAEDR